ncbi:MAG: AAA family ATPase [Gammaproteobacteria bacterium]|nr:AAA family ATPase [Gammaproteobacteria bacterium]
MVQKAGELDISVLAITDHNHVGGVPEFRAAAEGMGLHVFPGFELASSEGVHVLCIYPPETEQGQLERYLGAFGIRETAPSSDLADATFVEILAKVRQQRGLTIAAHVTNDGGLLRTLDGQACIRAWKSSDLLAVQIPGPVADLPQNARPIICNKNPDYAREHPADNDLAVAVVNAQDIARVEDLEDRSATCWIKMSEVSIEGLRQACLDPGSRIRLNPKDGTHAPDAHAGLLAMAWTGGFLDGARVRFNPNLNALVGGRGAGKSTVIESIRAVLGLDPIGEDARKAHEGIVRQVLRSGTQISLLVRVCRPAPKVYCIERTLPNPPSVRDEAGAVSNLTPAEVLRGVELFGQHEIAELTRSKAKRTRLLDRFIKGDDDAPRLQAALSRELAKNRRDLLDARSELDQIDERLAALPGLEETLEQFRKAGLEDKLKEQSLLVREERILKSARERLAPFRECAENLQRERPIDRAFVSQRALAELPGKAILGRLDTVLAELEDDLGAIARDLEAALDKANQGIESVRADWARRKQSVEDEYQKILRELHKGSVDGEAFIRLQRRIEALRPLREREAVVQRAVKAHAERRRNLLAAWEDCKAGAFRRLDRAAKSVNKKLRERVRIEVTAAGNREPLFDLLRDAVGGRLSEAIEGLRQQQDLSLAEFVEACRKGTAALQAAYGMPAAQAGSLAAAPSEVLMRVEELDLPATASIRLNTAPAGEPPAWQDLEALSTGQKATAVLLLLLLESEAPLIVDQPEDDLDNRFITEGVVPRMREEKRRRQFLFSTHNANIPVLGDAEMILGLAAKGEAQDGQARIARQHMGSIDSPAVRGLVEAILEGGKDAFERRRRKYGF